MQPPSAVVAFVVREVEVPEDIGRLSVCIRLISAFPLSQDAKVEISSNDGSAVSTPIPPGIYDSYDWNSVCNSCSMHTGEHVVVHWNGLTFHWAIYGTMCQVYTKYSCLMANNNYHACP